MALNLPLVIGACSGIMLLTVALLRSVRLINIATIVYSAMISLIAGYMLVAVDVPLYFLSNHYFFIDTLGLYEIIIVGIIFFLAAIYARGYVDVLLHEGELDRKNVKLFYLIFNLLLISLILAFSANNLALLWVFAEITTILSAILIVLLNAQENITAALKYVFITSTAMLFSFIGLLFLFAASKKNMIEPTLNWDLLVHHAPEISPQFLLFSFVFIFIGFAAKSGIVPFHNWLPPAHAKAPSDVSVLLSSAILNIGMYAIIRITAIVMHTPAGYFVSTFLLVFGIITVGVASFSMVVRTNLKKLIAFSSIENMGIMLVGIAGGNIFWVLYHTLAHALAKALLFFSAGIIHRQYNSINVACINNLFKLQPLAAGGLVVGSMAIIGTPLFPLFISKFQIVSSVSKISIFLTCIILLLLLIAAGAFAWFMIRLVSNQSRDLEHYKIPFSMKIPIVLLILMLLSIGIYFPEILRSLLEKILLEVSING